MEQNRVFGSRSDCSYVNPPEPKDKNIYKMKSAIKQFFGNDYDFSCLSEEDIKLKYEILPNKYKKMEDDFKFNSDKESREISPGEQVLMMYEDEKIDKESGYYDWADYYDYSKYQDYDE